MQSDERVLAALAVLQPQISLFRFAVSGTLERARSVLAAESSPLLTRVALGDFAGGRIDPDRFAMVSSGAEPLDAAGRDALQRVIDALEKLVTSGDDDFVVEVPSGESLAKAIEQRFAKLGLAFAATGIVELVRRRSFDPAQHSVALDSHPFERWSPSERKMSPPLVIKVDGRDIEPFGIAPFIDGCVRLVLIANEPCSPAPLARLISPTVFVSQSAEARIVDRAKDLEGPAVVALVDKGAALFTHDPRMGPSVWQRLEVTRVPEAPTRKSLGKRSAWQQREDVALLRTLAERPVLVKIGSGSAAGITSTIADPAERLTAWLLEQSSGAGVS
jgi:hypothetical protein